MILASVFEDVFRAFLQGLPAGSVYALIALGFVLTYKTSGVFNLAFGAQAYVSAALYFKLRVVWEWPILPAAVIAVVVVAPLLGLALERLIFRHLRTTSALPGLVLAIGLSVAIPSVFNELMNYEVVPGRAPPGLVNDGRTVFYEVFGVYSFNRDELVAMAVALIASVGLAAMFRFTALGLQMRAVVESPRLTELKGVAADRVSAASWMASSFFAGLAGVLIAPRFQTLVAGNFFQLMIIAIAGAAIGRLRSLPLALAGGLGLGVFIAEVNTFVPRWSREWEWLRPLQNHVSPAIPFIVLFLVIVAVPSVRRARGSADPLAGVDPPPALPEAHLVDPRDVWRRRIATVVFLAAVGAVVFTQADKAWLFIVTQGVVMAIVFLSITVITGTAGRISLCQGAFAATGSFTVFQLTSQHDLAPITAAFAGAFIAAAVALVLAVPVRRLGGVWTAIATLAFAYFFDAVVVKISWVSGGTTLFGGTEVPRPTIGPFDLGNDRSFLAFAIIVLVVFAVAVTHLQSGTFGRSLRAVGGSEVAAQSIGISVGRGRLVAFAVSGFIAAFGGALMAMHQEDVNYETNFEPFLALFWIVIVAVLGVGNVKSAIHAGAAFALFDPLVLKGALFGWILRSPDRLPGFFPISSSWVFILFGLAAIQFAKHPEGLLEHAEARRAERRVRKIGPAHDVAVER